LTKDETKLDARYESDADMGESKEVPPILIVEDTIELAEVIQATLEGMGLEAVYETHGKTGLERLRELNPNLVLMDIGLPDITGWKMLDNIKEHYTDIESEMPTIIVITAYGDPANRLIGKLQKIHSYLVKPFTPDQVERVVEMALRGEKPAEPTIGGEESPQS
jgi:CheY-like chemotaxis protein